MWLGIFAIFAGIALIFLGAASIATDYVDKVAEKERGVGAKVGDVYTCSYDDPPRAYLLKVLEILDDKAKVETIEIDLNGESSKVDVWQSKEWVGQLKKLK